jgi:hypothetical protein
VVPGLTSPHEPVAGNGFNVAAVLHVVSVKMIFLRGSLRGEVLVILTVNVTTAPGSTTDVGSTSFLIDNVGLTSVILMVAVAVDWVVPACWSVAAMVTVLGTARLGPPNAPEEGAHICAVYVHLILCCGCNTTPTRVLRVLVAPPFMEHTRLDVGIQV